MAEDINFGTLTDRLNFHFGSNQIQKIDQGGTTVWVNNQVPVVSITGPVVGTPGASNTDIQVTASTNQVVEFTYSDADAADTVSTITVTDPNGGNVNVSGFSAGQNSGTCTFTIASTWFTTTGPVTSNNVFTITATDNRGGVATSTVTVTAAAFNGPTITASNSSVTDPANASSTGTIPTPASGVFSKVSTTSTGLGFGNPALTSNTLSAVWSNGTCGTSISRTFYAASYDSNSGTWSGVSTKTVTLTVNSVGPYNVTMPNYSNGFIGGGGGPATSASYNYHSSLSSFKWDGDCAGTSITRFTARAYISPASGYAWKANTDFNYATLTRNSTTKTDSTISNPTSLTGAVDINWSTFYPTTSGMANFFSGVTPANASSQVPAITIFSSLNTAGAIPKRVWQNGNTTFSATENVAFNWTIPYTSPGGFTLADGPAYSTGANQPGTSGGGTTTSNYPSIFGISSSLAAISLTFPVAGTYKYYHSSSASFIGISAGGVATGPVLVPASHISTLTFNVSAAATNSNGTSGYTVTNTSSSTSGGGTSTSNNYGSWSAWTPTSTSSSAQCDQATVTVTQSRSRTRSITTTVAPTYETTVNTNTCTVLTSPTGTGTQPSCTSPSGAIGSSYTTSSTTTTSSGSSSTSSQPNENQTRSQSVTNTAYSATTTTFVRNTSIALTGGVFTQTSAGTCAPVDESIGCNVNNATCTVSSTRTPIGNRSAVMQTGNYVTTDCFGNSSSGGQVQIEYHPAQTGVNGTPQTCYITYSNPDFSVSCQYGTSQGFGSQELCNGTIVSGAQTACYKTGQPGINYSGTSC